jgi:hypothetical protein
MRLKPKPWTTDIPRWEWEKTRKVLVFVMNDKLEIVKREVIKHIRDLLSEFTIPLSIVDGHFEHSADLTLIEQNLRQSLNSNRIDYYLFKEKIGKNRKGMERLREGLVIVVDKDKLEFLNEPNKEEKAIYGVGFEDGLVILRCTHRESVRHEFAHMLGLDHHNPKKPECIMNWECAVPTFCDDCKQQIGEIWEDEIKGRKIQ